MSGIDGTGMYRCFSVYMKKLLQILFFIEIFCQSLSTANLVTGHTWAAFAKFLAFHFFLHRLRDILGLSEHVLRT